MNTALKISLLLILLGICTSKVITTTFTVHTLQKQEFQYLTKFAMNIGSGLYTIRLRFLQAPSPQSHDRVTVKIPIVTDKNWPVFLEQKQCNQRLNYANVSPNAFIPLNGDWSVQIDGYLTQQTRRYYWYFALVDCEKNLVPHINRPSSYKIQVEIKIKNVDESQFSADEEGFIIPYLILIIGASIVFYMKFTEFWKQYKRDDELDWPFFLALLSLGLQTLSFYFEFFNQWSYSNNGQGIAFFYVMYQLFGIAAQFVITIFLVLISWGWTLTYNQLDSYDIYVPLAIMVGVIHLMIVGLGNINNDDHKKMHQYDGVAGTIVIILRLGMFIYYLFGIRETSIQASQKIKQFIIYLAIFGSLYFLAFPVLVLVSNFCDSYVRNLVITYGGLCFQTIAIVTIIYMNTSQNSLYYQASFQSSALLPNGQLD